MCVGVAVFYFNIHAYALEFNGLVLFLSTLLVSITQFSNRSFVKCKARVNFFNLGRTRLQPSGLHTELSKT